MKQTLKSLDRQFADERARHPTPQAAACAGAGFALFIGIPTEIDRLAAGPLTARSLGIGLLVLAIATVLAIVVSELGAALVRWRRRLAARMWYPDREQPGTSVTA